MSEYILDRVQMRSYLQDTDDSPARRSFIETLLESGRDLSSNYCYFFLHEALRLSEREDIIIKLIKKCTVFKYAFCIALQCGSTKKIVEHLADAGCSMSKFCEHGSVLHCAIDSKKGLKPDVLQLLVDRGADVRAQTESGQTVLCRALQNGEKVSTIQLLLNAGASWKECVSHSSPFFCAIDRNYTYRERPLQAEVVKLLLQSGASANVLSSDGCDPFNCALQDCAYEMEAIKLLASYLPDIADLANHYLFEAVVNDRCNPGIVKFLIQHGAEIGNRLHIALDCTSVHVIQAFLENGAEVNQKDRFGKTPLNAALSSYRDPNILELLLSAGALIERSMFKDVNLSFSCVKVLLKYFILQNYGSKYLVNRFRSCNEYDAMLEFIEECNLEIKKMKSMGIGKDFTLHEFVKGRPPPRKGSVALQLPEKKYNFDRLLKVLSDDPYPVYFNIIEQKVLRESQEKMEKMLEEVIMYSVVTVTSPVPNTCVEKKIALPLPAKRKIAEFSNGWLRLILASCNPREDRCNRDDQSNKTVKKRLMTDIDYQNSKRAKSQRPKSPADT